MFENVKTQYSGLVGSGFVDNSEDAGEDAARFDELFRKNYRVIRRAARARIADQVEADDIAADVFAAAWRRRRDADHVFTLPWLYTTLRHRVGVEYRRRERSDNRLRAVEDRLRADAAAASDRELVRETVRLLPEAERTLLSMWFWEGMTGAEMAEVLGCSVEAVHVRVHRSKRKLAEKLPRVEQAE